MATLQTVERAPRCPLTALLRRLGVALAGGATVLLGLVLVPLPGPGWVVVGLGVALLGTEFPWAARLTGRVRHGVTDARRALSGRPVLRVGAAGVSAASVVLPLLLLR